VSSKVLETCGFLEGDNYSSCTLDWCLLMRVCVEWRVVWSNYFHIDALARWFIYNQLCVFCVFLFHTAYVLYYIEHGGVDLMGLKPNP